MNRPRFPFCHRCKTNYYVSGDLYGFKIPMLLSCGHDICRSCTKLQYKKDQKIICGICSADSEINSYDQLNEIPVHYYLVGKIWCLTSQKQNKMRRDICNLNLTNLISESSKKVKKNCQLCHKYASIFCPQCNDVFCKVCSEKVHVDNEIMSHHDLEKLDDIHLEPPEYKCDIHLKLIEFICVPCQLHLCSTCAIKDHRLHDIQPLEDYNKTKQECLNEYTLRGDNLIRNLENCKNDLHMKLQKHMDYSMKKNNDSDKNKNKVMMFVSSLIGALQRIELNVLNMVNQSDTSIVQSLNTIIHQLNSFIHDIRSKLNQVDLMLNKNQCPSATVEDLIVDLERTLGTTYYIAKKNNVKTSIVFNTDIFDAIKQCIVPNVDLSDTYLLSNTLNFPSDYTLISSTMKTENNAPVPIRPFSSTSNISTSSNHSAKSTGEIESQKLDHSSVKEITKNKVETVVITHLNSPSDFYLQLRDNLTTLKAVSDEMKEFVQKKQSAVECIVMDNVMYAVQLSTNEWCRGVVVHICNENGINCYTVHCIDYGYTETLTSNKIRKVPASVASIPSLANNCALYDLKPSTTTGWSNEAYQLFRDLITEDKTISFYIYPIETNGDRIEVDVICNDIHPMSIRDAMLYLGYGSTENYMTIALREKLLSIITLPGDKMLQEEAVYSITISHLYSPSEFYFRIAEDDESLIEIMKKLESLYKPTEKDTNKNFLLYTPQIGMAVAARYSIDNTWYRAKIISLPESRMVTIYYIDFGNSETLPWDQLRVLDQSLINIPPLAVKALLVDVYPAVDGIECTNWSDDATAAFFNLVKNYNSMEDKLTANIMLVDNDSHKVVLYNHTSRGEVCVNSKLVSQGHAVGLDPGSYSFTKENTRTPLDHNLPKLLYANSRNKSIVYTTEDTLAFTKPWTIVDDLNHTWPKNENSKDVPGVEMSIIKVVSPDEITLKLVNYNPARLIECMNNVYKKSKNNYQKTQWKINELCAVFKKEFGNWYRGKILNYDTKKCTASVLFYDLDQINHGIPVNSLHILPPNLINIKCGIVHCCMDNLVPLGDSDSKWPKFSCDRLIEELKKYSVVYFSKKGKKDNIALGEIWVKEVQMPEALKPIRERWINMNKFMIEQGFAISNKQNAKQDDEYLTSQLEPELNQTFESLKNVKATNYWLLPKTITKSRFNAWVTYVDMNCNVYLQDIDRDSETLQLLTSISEELSSVFSNTQPEPINVKWSEGQMVIVRYHLDEQWYRGTIIKVKENCEFSVQFLDYGNIETCSHEDLRSTLYMTDIPQLCFKGFFTSILPMTENNKWEIDTLDYLHSLIVEQTCTVTVDLSLTSGSSCAISKITTGNPTKDICQLLVSQNAACYEYASKLVGRISANSNDHGKSSDAAEKSDPDKGSDAAEKSDPDKGSDAAVKSARVSRYPSIATRAARDEAYEVTSSGVDDQESCSSVSSVAATCAEKDECGDDEGSSTTNHDERSDVETPQRAEPEQSPGFFRFCLDTNEVVEGTLCKVISPVCMTLMIEKIGGIDVTESKNLMQTDMIKKCAELPPLGKIVPGTAVVVMYNFLWRRGTIGDDARSVYLVDLGIPIMLVKCKARLCPSEFFALPMFTIDCHLANVTKSEDADAKDVVEKMSKLLKGVELKIVWISDSANGDETVYVDLYNSAGEIAYQPLIDSRLLIPM